LAVFQVREQTRVQKFNDQKAWRESKHNTTTNKFK